MCRNIKRLYPLDPPVTDAELRDASLQFVRKVSGFSKPSTANADAFDHAVEQVTQTIRTLMGSLVTASPPRTREAEAARARARGAARAARANAAS